MERDCDGGSGNTRGDPVGDGAEEAITTDEPRSDVGRGKAPDRVRFGIVGFEYGQQLGNGQ